MKSAKISEIFKSAQGEGPYTGVEQLFVRFFGCSLGCAYCDTPQNSFELYSVDQLRNVVLTQVPYHSLSLTGGEPLVHADFLKEFLEQTRDLSAQVYLETNGIFASALKKIIDDVDIVAMDFKLPSSTKQKAFWKEHEDFLKVACLKEAFVKMVITKHTEPDDLVTARGIIKKINPGIPVILQPNWNDINPGLLEEMDVFKKDLTLHGLGDVRILPQAHKMSGIK